MVAKNSCKRRNFWRSIDFSANFNGQTCLNSCVRTVNLQHALTVGPKHGENEQYQAVLTSFIMIVTSFHINSEEWTMKFDDFVQIHGQ
jgi:hypothetical protein